MSTSYQIGSVISMDWRRYRLISQALSATFYVDQVNIWPDGVLARAMARYVRWWARIGSTIAVKDGLACGLREGECFHWWMLGWWLGKPLLWINRICPRIDGLELAQYGNWPSTLEK